MRDEIYIGFGNSLYLNVSFVDCIFENKYRYTFYFYFNFIPENSLN